MGLDITAYSKLTLMEGAKPTADLYDDPTAIRIYVNPDFPGRQGTLTTGWYRQEEGGEFIDFRAGSYSGYNLWRDDLAAMVGTTPKKVWADPTPGPFMELINFADNEGVIGPEVSAKLAQDFDTFRLAAEEIGGKDEKGAYFWERYQKWHKAFQIAADGGGVCFH